MDDPERQQEHEHLKQLWRTLDLMLSSAADFIYIFDLEGQFTYINQALLTLWQKSLDQALGKNFFELDYPPDLAARLQAQIQEVIETRRPVRGETAYTGATGESRYYEYIFVPVVGSDDRIEAVAGSTRDVTERASREQRTQQRAQVADRELHRTNQELQAITDRLIGAQDEERRRLARELHDDLAQRLAVLEHQLSHARQHVRSDPGLAEEKMDSLAELAAGISNEVRLVSHRLHPPGLDDLGLVPALRNLCEEFKQTYGMPVCLTVQGPTSLPLPLCIATALYRIAQEGLRNVAKHAPNADVVIELITTTAEIGLTIRDSGPGFAPEGRALSEGLGIISMQERARLLGGLLDVQSSPGAGTEIIAIVPLPKGSTAQEGG